MTTKNAFLRSVGLSLGLAKSAATPMPPKKPIASKPVKKPLTAAQIGQEETNEAAADAFNRSQSPAAVKLDAQMAKRK